MAEERISPWGSGERSPKAGVHHRPADPTCPVRVLQAPLRRREAPRTVAPRSYCPRIKAGELPEGRAARRRPGGWRLTEALRNPQALVRGGFSCMNLSSHQLKSSTLYLYLQRQGPSTFVDPRSLETLCHNSAGPEDCFLKWRAGLPIKQVEGRMSEAGED